MAKKIQEPELRWPVRRRPHALLLPFPAQGHINAFTQLSQVLIRRNTLVTFVNTQFNHDRIRPVSSSAQIRFVYFPDGLPPDHQRTRNLPEFVEVLHRTAPSQIDELIRNSDPPVDAMISDTSFMFAQDIADAHAIPRIVFRTTSACGCSAYFHIATLIKHGYIPLADSERENMEKPVTCIPGMERIRVKDLPSFLTTADPSDYLFEHLLELRRRRDVERASMLLINTWEELEAPVLDQLNAQLSGKIAAIGPSLLMQEEERAPESSNSSSLWEEENACLEWLDKQKPGSVLYVSFGSVAVFSEQQLQELALGVEQSKCPFLWVLRRDEEESSVSSVKLPLGFHERCQDGACFVGWAPQWKVLQHRSVTAFLTHSGWNSTVESICAGVPMMCWPYFAEQTTNRRFVSAVWKVGWEIDEDVKRAAVAEMVRKLLDPTDAQGCFVRENVRRLRDSAYRAVSEGGSSHSNLNRLLDLMAARSCFLTPETALES